MARQRTKDSRREVRPPLQARSRDTLRRIMETTESLLEGKAFDAITVGEIARGSKSSVGAFYARFADKAALLDHLEALRMETLGAAIRQYKSEERWATAPVGELIGSIVRLLARFYRTHRGLLRTLSFRARREGAGEGTGVERHVPAIVALLLGRRGEIGHSSPDQAVHLGCLMVIGTLRERVLFPESHPGRLRIPDSLLADELTLALEAYLGVAVSGR